MRRKRLIPAVFAVMAVAACTAFGKADVKAAEIPQEVKEAVDTEGLKSVYETLFDEDLEKQGVQVVSQDEAQGVPVAITELSNGKKAYSVDGQPFYPIAVETGWWDTRVDDNGKMSSNQADVGDNFKNVTDREWNSYFSDMKNMGFNTVQLMIYWEDWEPRQGEYDFSFLDHVTGLAAENGLKTEMIIFFHSQTDNIPRIKDTFWGYNMDNMESGGEKYALSMQWGNNLTNQGFKTAFKITVQEAQYVTNLVEAPGSTGGLRNLFDGNLNTAAGYVADDETMEGIKAGEYYIQYNFDKKVLFDGVSLSTNYAVDQAILEFKLAVLSEDGSWVFLGEDENQVHRVNWETNNSNIETQKVSIDPVAADKVRMYVTDVANKWKDNAGGTVHKFEMSEIQFHFSELPEVTGIYIKEMPEKTEYAIGEQIDTTGLVVMSVYSDGSEQDISGQVEISGFDASSEGEKKIQVNYEGKWTAAFSVTVCVPEKLIVIPPDKTVYMIGEELDLIGIQVFSELPSGRRIQIPAEEVQISGADFSTEGEKTIQISYQGVTAEFKVTVQAQEDKPDQGNKTDQQNKPTVTDSGKKPADTSASDVSSGQKAPKTGDTTSPVVLLGILLAASVISGTFLYRRVRK